MQVCSASIQQIRVHVLVAENASPFARCWHPTSPASMRQMMLHCSANCAGLLITLQLMPGVCNKGSALDAVRLYTCRSWHQQQQQHSRSSHLGVSFTGSGIRWPALQDAQLPTYVCTGCIHPPLTSTMLVLHLLPEVFQDWTPCQAPWPQGQ